MEDDAAALRALADAPIAAAIVAGSGLSAALRDEIGGKSVRYDALRSLRAPTAPTHVGELLVGTVAEEAVLVFLGRFHLYEGHSANDVVAPIDLAIATGARTVVLTSAAGALDPTYCVGDVVVATDQLNLTGHTPLDGAHFVDMTGAYSTALRERTLLAAKELGVVAHEGIYAGLRGPAFETPAEAHALRSLGADVVGFSTVLETIAARAAGCDVASLSLVTNIAGSPASPGEILAASARCSRTLARIVVSVLAATFSTTPLS